jgi:hypothetical protein
MPAAGTRARRIILFVLLALAAGGIAYEAAGPAPIDTRAGSFIATQTTVASSAGVAESKSTVESRPKLPPDRPSEPLPPRGTPLSSEFDELDKRA